MVRVEDGLDVYYCWICDCEKKRQGLPAHKGKSSALNHMMSHGDDRDGNRVDKGARSIPGAAAL